jgi:hypothetical protein
MTMSVAPMANHAERHPARWTRKPTSGNAAMNPRLIATL